MGTKAGVSLYHGSGSETIDYQSIRTLQSMPCRCDFSFAIGQIELSIHRTSDEKVTYPASCRGTKWFWTKGTCCHPADRSYAEGLEVLWSLGA